MKEVELSFVGDCTLKITHNYYAVGAMNGEYFLNAIVNGMLEFDYNGQEYKVRMKGLGFSVKQLLGAKSEEESYKEAIQVDRGEIVRVIKNELIKIAKSRVYKDLTDDAREKFEKDKHFDLNFKLSIEESKLQ